MEYQGLVYRVTELGRRSLEDISVPADYRRLLAFVGTEAHSDVIRSFLRRYPDQLIFEWLDELTELDLLIPGPEKPTHDLDFTDNFLLPELLKEDQQRLTGDAEIACDLLSRKGIYIASDRILNRAALNKAPEDSNILIVEDDPDQLRLATKRLAMAGYLVRTAESASALRTSLRGSVPDLLLLDVMLPDGNGFDILSSIRRHSGSALLPVVMLTAKDTPADVQTGLALGADGYMTKPYSKASVAEVIQYVLAG
jgi:two-component system, OmpR family, response regulator